MYHLLISGPDHAGNRHKTADKRQKDFGVVIRSENNNADIGNNRYAGHKRFFPPLSRKKYGSAPGRTACFRLDPV